MNQHDVLGQEFETHRSHLRAVAYRMLGSASEAEDAVQEAWLRLSRSPASEIENLGGWLTTVVARVCLDALRSRKARPQQPLDAEAAESSELGGRAPDPEAEAELADSVGLALLVVLDTLSPPERLAFVLHDLFAVSFEEIAEVLGRSPVAARQLASRARRRVQGQPALGRRELEQQRGVVEAFLAALRSADFDGLLAVLDPEIVAHVDAGPGQTREIRGAHNWAKGALAFSRLARFTCAALVDGRPGIVLAPRGRLRRALRLRFENGRIAEIDVIMDRARLEQLQLGVLGGVAV